MTPPVVDAQTKLFDYLLVKFSTYKRTKLKQLLKYGSVVVNDRVVTAYDWRLSPGDKVDFLDRQSSVRNNLKNHLSFDVVYEDDSIIVIDKPAGLLTMGTERDKINTAYFELTSYARSQSKDGKGRIFIVHRLDREVSGLIVFAKRVSDKLALQENWDKAVKKYYAIVEGTPKKSSGLIESYLLEDHFRRVYSAGDRSPGAKLAKTKYQVVRTKGRYSLLDVTLLTGRKNQIRVHLSEEGYPIVGDTKYGSTTEPVTTKKGTRMALHAHYLSVLHPVTGKMVSFESPLPAPLAKLV